VGGGGCMWELCGMCGVCEGCGMCGVCGVCGGVGVCGDVGGVGVWGHSLRSTFHRLHLLRLWTPTILYVNSAPRNYITVQELGSVSGETSKLFPHVGFATGDFFPLSHS
jgi:hypothetical protein